MKEIWKDVVGYEGLYLVSNLGRVESLVKNIILKARLGKRGYFIVGLSNNGEKKTFTIHRLVAIAFIENNNNKREVNHKDGNKLNNIVNNLEWVTPKENTHHAIRTGLIPEGFYQEKTRNLVAWIKQHKRKSITQIENGKIIAIYDSLTEAANTLVETMETGSFTSAASGILNCCRGRAKTAYGCKWEYAS